MVPFSQTHNFGKLKKKLMAQQNLNLIKKISLSVFLTAAAVTKQCTLISGFNYKHLNYHKKGRFVLVGNSPFMYKI